MLFISAWARPSTSCCNILITKLVKYRPVKRLMRMAEIRLNCQAQRVIISGTKSGWGLVTSSIPPGVISLNLFFKIVHWRRAYITWQI